MLKWAEKFRALFETAVPGRTNDIKRSDGDANRSTYRAGPRLREQARHLEENHDLVSGILTTLVNNTVGPTGISVEPLPKKRDGTIDRDFADELIVLWDDWSKRPEVTGEHTRGSMERLLARSWFRDGEAFLQHLAGPIPTLRHGTRVPYSVEMLEADMVPLDHPDNVAVNDYQGITKNEWGQPLLYRVYLRHPGSIKAWDTRTKQIPADNMVHLKLTNRIGQTRGVSAFAPVLIRLNDLKSYEEAERIAARMSACIGMYIKRGNPDQYTMAELDEDDDRIFEMAPGMIYDQLLPGEELNDITPDRPSQLLQPFRDSMLKAVAAGVGCSYSSIARDYEGTYSSQRQELVEQFINYGVMQQMFIGQVTSPIWEQFVTVALANGMVKLPRSVDPETILDAQFRGPVMPWIDPAKESSANLIQVRAGFKSISQVIRERGENPRHVFAEIQREREELEEMEIALSSVESTDDTNFGGTDDGDQGEGQGLRTQGDDEPDSGSDDKSGGVVRLR